jgi:hypothetical protein
MRFTTFSLSAETTLLPSTIECRDCSTITSLVHVVLQSDTISYESRIAVTFRRSTSGDSFDRLVNRSLGTLSINSLTYLQFIN